MAFIIVLQVSMFKMPHHIYKLKAIHAPTDFGGFLFHTCNDYTFLCSFCALDCVVSTYAIWNVASLMKDILNYCLEKSWTKIAEALEHYCGYKILAQMMRYQYPGFI